MDYIKLGATEIKVSLEGLGCMGMSEFYGNANNAQSEKVISVAIESGINFFDTADVYAFGDNERLIGKVIGNLPQREQLVLATKCGIIRDKKDVQKRGVDNSPEYIKKCCDLSLDRLGTYIDLYYLHRVVDDSPTIKEAMKSMASLLKVGKIRAVGLSETNEKNIRYAHQCLLEETSGKHGISAVQTEYSLLSRGVEKDGVLKTCDELGITFVAYSPISRGLLSGELTTLEHLDSNDFRRALPRFSDENLAYNNQITKIIYEMAKEKKCTPAQLSLAWLMHNKASVVPIPGTKKIQHLEQNIDAVNIKLTANEHKHLSTLSKGFKAKGLRYSEQAMKSYALSE